MLFKDRYALMTQALGILLTKKIGKGFPILQKNQYY